MKNLQSYLQSYWLMVLLAGLFVVFTPVLVD